MINEEKRKIQIEALEALEQNKYNGVFILPTGSGKSWVLIEALKRLVEKYDYKNIWYLCNSTDLRDRDFPKELEEWGAGHLKDRITFMCYQTAYKLENQEVDVVLADEFDYSLTPEYSKVYLNNKFRYRILTTAFIDKEKMPYLERLGVFVVYSKGLQQVEDAEVLNKSQYYFVNFLMTDAESKEYLQLSNRVHQLWGEVKNPLTPTHKLKYLNYRLELATRARKHFLNALQSSIKMTRRLIGEIYNADKNCKVLTFCELTKQADAICKYSYHGDSDPTNLDKFRNDEIQVLTVCGKINRGVNIRGINNIIFESCNQSKTQLTQRLGRGKRLGVDEILNVYFMIPCYQENGKVKFTKVKDWVLNAAAKLDLSNAKTYRFKG